MADWIWVRMRLGAQPSAMMAAARVNMRIFVRMGIGVVFVAVSGSAVVGVT